MITYIISKKKYKVPTSYNDVTYNTFCSVLIFEGDGLDLLALKTSIPVEILKQIDIASLKELHNLVKFFDNPDYLNTVAVIDKKIEETTNIGLLPVGKLFACQQALEVAQTKIKDFDAEKHTIIKFILAGAEIIKAYVDVDITDKPITQYYGMILFFSQRLQSFMYDGKKQYPNTNRPRKRLKLV